MPKRKKLPDLSREEVRLEDLKPYAANARTHPKQQIQKLVRSIKEFGFLNPLLIDEGSEVIAGHGRLIAAKEAGLQKLPVIRIRGLSVPQKRALRLADNQIALESSWDMELVREELYAISLDPACNLELTGFDAARIDVLLDDSAGDPDDEVVPAVPIDPVSQTGDIWIAGPHRIGCGNVRTPGFLKAIAKGKAVDAAFLDPPYNVRVDGHVCGKGKTRHREFAEASGEMSSSEFTQFLRDTLGACAEVCKSGAVHFVCMDHGHLGELLVAGNDVYGTRLNLCVWNKSNAGMGSLYRSKHELVLIYRVGEGPHRNNVELGKHGRNRTNVWDYPSVNTFARSRRQDLDLHPTVKPVGLVADAILDVTKRGETVLDAFLGSGTTLIAAERTGRAFVGLDIDPAYVDTALMRWRDMTGVEPMREHDGATFRDAKAMQQNSEEAER